MRRLRRALRRALDLLPLTPLGLALGLGAWWTRQRYGIEEADFILLSASTFALALLALCLLVTIIGAIRAAWALGALPPLELRGEVGAPLDTGARLPRFGAWWPLLLSEVSWATPEGVEVTRFRGERERVRFSRRGRYAQIERALLLSDLFGLTAIRVRRRAQGAAWIAPSTATAELRVALRRSSGEGLPHPDGEPLGDRVEMRRYVVGDPLRFVLWKTYARTRKLLVRTPERALLPQPSTVAIFMAGPEDEPSASTARACLEQGLLGEDYLFGASGADALARSAEVGVEQLVDSARLEDPWGVSRLLDALGPSQLSHCVFFLPGREGPWVEAILQISRRLPKPPTLLLTTTRRPQATPQPRGVARLFTRSVSLDEGAEALEALTRRLRASGGEVRLIEGGAATRP